MKASTLNTAATLGALALGAVVAVALVRQVRRASSAAGAALGRGLDAVTPTNPQNVFAQGANALARTVTGDSNVTLGTAIRDFVERIAGTPRADAPSPLAAQFNQPVPRSQRADGFIEGFHEGFEETTDRDDMEFGLSFDQLTGRPALTYRTGVRR